MNRATAEKVADLLHCAAHTIKYHGRPRKWPKTPRPEAVSFDGAAISPYKMYAEKFSLLGALKADCRELGYSRRVLNRAAGAFIEAYYGYDDDFNTPLVWVGIIDNNEKDTRELIRALRKAARNIAADYAKV